ncbi:MAG: DUF72 domain-containing protein [Deltaproteobacteria bacterium]|nr:DUF72 domain-containing protein [Deltaproteobacteria bacterium]
MTLLKLQPSESTSGVSLWVGTSGYSYPEWVDAGIYPPGTKSARMLPLYARDFAVTELNYTWYQMPRAEAIERQRALVPPIFKFCAKLTRTMTHEIDAKTWQNEAAKYRHGIAPLLQSRQLLAILIQFSAGFERSTKNRNYLSALLEELQGLPLAVEFRNASWANGKVFTELERRQVTLVSVDEPSLPGLFPSLDIVSNPELFYVRFHGRNAKGWGSGKMAQQFDYNYSDDELAKWLEEKLQRMITLAKNGVLFFNNHVRGQAPRNAQQLVKLLTEAGWRAGG